MRLNQATPSNGPIELPTAGSLAAEIAAAETPGRQEGNSDGGGGGKMLTALHAWADKTGTELHVDPASPASPLPSPLAAAPSPRPRAPRPPVQRRTAGQVSIRTQHTTHTLHTHTHKTRKPHTLLESAPPGFFEESG